MALPRTLKLMNTFVNGNSFFGVATEVELPKLTMIEEDFRPGGFYSPVKINLGVEALEMTHKYGGYDGELYAGFANPIIDNEMVRFAGSIQRDDTGEVSAVEVIARGRHTEIDGGTSKAGELTEIAVKTVCSYYKLSVAGRTVIEIDVPNCVCIINGKDTYAEHRAAIGL